MITTLAEAEAHQRKHGFLKGGDALCKREKPETVANPKGEAASTFKPKGRQMTKTEREFSLILEAMKRRGEIIAFEYQGITLRWPVGDKVIRYTPDFVVIKTIPIECESCGKRHTRLQTYVRFIEVKGSLSLKANIYGRTVERFKHAITRWPMFQFEMHQRQKGGQWQRIH